MRDPNRYRNISLGACGVFGLLIATAPVAPVVAAFSVGFLVVSGIGVAYFHYEGKKLEKLASGEIEISRWTIPPDIWMRFLHENSRWAADAKVAKNIIDVGDVRAGEAVEVLAAMDCIRVGRDFHSFGSDIVQAVNWIHCDPIWVAELLIRIESKSTSTVVAMRVPTGKDGSAAQRAMAAWNWRYMLNRNYDLASRQKLGLLLGALGLMLLAFVIAFVGDAIGVWVLGVAAVILAAIGAVLIRSSQKKRAALRTGTVLGEWTVSARDAEAFCKWESEYARSSGAAYNFFGPPKAKSWRFRLTTHGMDAGKQLFVWRDIHTEQMPVPHWIDGPVPVLEWRGTYQTRSCYGSYTVRVPVAAEAVAALRQKLSAAG